MNCCGVEYLEDDCVFKQASFDFDKIMQDIIFYVWFWLKNIAAINICSFSQWQSHIATGLLDTMGG